MLKTTAVNYTTVNPEATSKGSALRIFVMLGFMVLSCGSAFGQDRSPNLSGEGYRSEIPSGEVSSESNNKSTMQLLLWFMGSKQITPEKGELNSEEATGKKLFINLGMTPNRTLSKSLMKKALNYDQTMA